MSALGCNLMAGIFLYITFAFISWEQLLIFWLEKAKPQGRMGIHSQPFISGLKRNNMAVYRQLLFLWSCQLANVTFRCT